MLRLRVGICGGKLDTIAKTAHAPDRDARGPKFVPETADMNLERVRRRIGLRREYGIEQRLLRNDFVHAGKQHIQYLKLARGEIDWSRSRRGAHRGLIEAELPEL